MLDGAGSKRNKMREIAYVCKDRLGNKVLPGCHYWEWNTKGYCSQFNSYTSLLYYKIKELQASSFFFFFCFCCCCDKYGNTSIIILSRNHKVCKHQFQGSIPRSQETQSIWPSGTMTIYACFWV